MSRVYLSIEEAEELLPQVEKKLKTLISLEEEIKLLNEVRVKNPAQELEDYLVVLNMKHQYHDRLSQFYMELLELTKMGCMVKDLRKGLVDFYSKKGSRDILLCWRLGETGIRYWHDPGTGFASRQPVEILKSDYERQLKRFR